MYKNMVFIIYSYNSGINDEVNKPKAKTEEVCEGSVVLTFGHWLDRTQII